MLKVRTQDLESIKKQLVESNKVLLKIKHISPTDAWTNEGLNRQLKANEKQIKLLENEYYIA